ncbi:unnamed protein product [Hapterophycus canaliculatus]
MAQLLRPKVHFDSAHVTCCVPTCFLIARMSHAAAWKTQQSRRVRGIHQTVFLRAQKRVFTRHQESHLRFPRARLPSLDKETHLSAPSRRRCTIWFVFAVYATK